MNSLGFRAIELRRNGRLLFAPLTLTIEPGVVASIMGPSGSGKSTLLSYACGALPAAFTGSGDILLGAQRLNGMSPEDRRLGLLFQDDLLFPHLSVADNLAFGMRRATVRRIERRERIAESLASLGLQGCELRDPFTLAGGERARGALLRVLLSEPRAVLLDEPFSRLDASTRTQTRAVVFEEIRKRSLPALLVTHDAEDVAAAAGPVALLQPSREI